MTTASEALKVIKDSGAKYLDLRFTDVKGKWQHLTMDGTIVDEDFLNEGTFFDGSSIAGWKPINESDMVLKPDLSTLVMDPFTAQPTMMLFCDILMHCYVFSKKRHKTGYLACRRRLIYACVSQHFRIASHNHIFLNGKNTPRS